MRHPRPPIHRRLGASPNPGPAIADPEHFGEIVHLFEVLEPVALLPGQQPDVDEHEDDATQILGTGDAPVLEDRLREQSELLQREIAARPGELRAAQVAARRQPALGELEGCQHEQVAAVLIAAVALPDLGERLLQRGKLAHGAASRGRPCLFTRSATGRADRGSSSASSSTWSSVSTVLISISFFTSSGTSTRSF